MTSCIHFIRHGVTRGILNKWFYGFEDLPLVKEGFDQLAALKAQGIYPSARGAGIYTSGMLRANQTLEAIYGSIPFTVIENLKEMNFGRWECKTFDELKAMAGFDDWMNDKDGSFAFPGGESPKDFALRAARGFNELMAHHRIRELSESACGNDTVSIAVCHGGVIASAICYFMEKPRETFWDWIPKPGRGYTIYFEDGIAVKYEPL